MRWLVSAESARQLLCRLCAHAVHTIKSFGRLTEKVHHSRRRIRSKTVNASVSQVLRRGEDERSERKDEREK